MPHAQLHTDRHAVEVSGLTLIRGRLPVLRGIDLAIKTGESLLLTGPNGAGKTTLLGCLAGLTRPTAGQVCWFGCDDARAACVRRHIGFAGHERGLYVELTALENLVFAGRMCGVCRPASRAAQLLESAGLTAYADRPVSHLSHGMRGRLSIARAIIGDPLLLLLDEPFSGLDEDGRAWLEKLLRALHRNGRTTCYSSQEIAAALCFRSRTVHINSGRVVDDEIVARDTELFLQSA
jgi:heme exporter protein A